ncbi:hypothetical protein [Spirulina sp. 06S082]|uniref:hypothetical protein n=1 Tax=Spirulina sp. 06S082 TaxID=3110248 RepID=UPI002B1F6A74|nr:hypothetical protein [Spirulina sp. 06S082]MEA5467423.1 hypothetical protein [Spirulina sp. 06S082]
MSLTISMNDPFYEKPLQRLQEYIYLIPIFGVLPALWTLKRDRGTPEQRKICRLSITLALGWLLAYALLSFGGSQTSEIFRFRLLFLNSLVGSGYFLTCLAIMIRLFRRQSLRVSGASQIAEGIVRKTLS